MSRIKYFIIIASLLGGSGCQLLEPPAYHDPYNNLTKHQYQSILDGAEEAEEEQPPAIEASSADTSPALHPALRQQVSLSLTKAVPVEEIFLALGQQTKVSFLLDCAIEGSTTLHVEQEELLSVVKMLCKLCKLRYTIVGKSIRIEPDIPYLENYEVQTLNIERTHQNRIASSSDVFNAMEEGRLGRDNGSHVALDINSKSQFWQELENNLQVILAAGAPYKGQYTIHKQAGLLSIYATQQQHQYIKAYLEKVIASIQQQVVIEAKILEVTLAEQFQTGINWHSMRHSFKLAAPIGPNTIADTAQHLSPIRNVMAIGHGSKNFTGLINMLSTFGTVRTLSNPRVTVLNNQPALLKAATNHVFFRIDYQRDIKDKYSADQERATSHIQTIPIGIVLFVHPTIDTKTRRIMLVIRPTISRIAAHKEDPAVSILSKQAFSSKVPEVQVREFDSMLQLKSGDFAIMGGLMEEVADNEHSGLPGSENVPIVHNLLGSQSHKRHVSELVIFLRATLVDNPKVPPADHHLYQTYAKDPRLGSLKKTR